jgi:FPC/CPF motif-containing protein YcgG
MSRLLHCINGVLLGEGDDPIPGWVSERHSELRQMLSAPEPPFPCYFATIAEVHGRLRYSYLTRTEISDPVALAPALTQYLSEHPTIDGRSALIVFVLTDKSQDHKNTFWTIIQSLHLLDSKPWPNTVPDDPDDPRWTFCFAGIPIFIAGHAPCYHERKSRYSASGLFLVIQPRSNLKGIAGKSLAATRVRDRIRSALKNYDLIGPSPDLGTYGDPHVREWRQYWLADTNDERTDTCPLTLNN